jgi:membrane-associated phospholipid phosphatase
VSAVGQIRPYEEYRDLSSIWPIPRHDVDRARARVWAVIGLVLLVVGAIVGVAAAGPGIVPGDETVLRVVQAPVWSGLDDLAWVVSRAGDFFPAVVFLLVAATTSLTLAGRFDLALFVAVAVALRAIGPVLKQIENSARPPAEVAASFEHVRGLGFPSGHALGAALFWGAITVVAPHVIQSRRSARLVQGLSIAMIVLTAWARVRLGVHWPSDVLGGVAIGVGFVALLRAGTVFIPGRSRGRAMLR